MKIVPWGKSGIAVSELVLGTDLIGSRIDQETSFKLFDFYTESGGTLLDTANFYASWMPGCHGGESETTIGRWIAERGNRNQILLASKLAFDYPGSPGGLSAAEIERECEKSLRRLRTDRIDIYYSHRDDLETPLEETMAAFGKLIQAGKVRAIGASNLPLWRIAEANTIARLNGWPGYSVVEQRYTYLRPRHGASFGPQIFLSEDMKDFATRHGIGLIGYSVLLQGAYTRQDREIPAQFAGHDTDERLQALKAVAATVGATPNQVVLAWMRQGNPSIIPIIAGSRTEQLAESIDALKIYLSAEQMELLSAAGNPAVERPWLQPS